MDGWSRPNHMPSHLDALQTPGPVNLRRFPGGLHSVAKRASFRVAFWSDFRGFWRPKWTLKFKIFKFFFDMFFDRMLASIFASFFEAPDYKNSNFP